MKIYFHVGEDGMWVEGKNPYDDPESAHYVKDNPWPRREFEFAELTEEEMSDYRRVISELAAWEDKLSKIMQVEKP